MNETLTRIFSGIAIAVVYISFFFYGEYSYLTLFFFMIAVDLIVMKEFLAMFLKKSDDPFLWNTGLVFSVLMVCSVYLDSLWTYSLHSTIEPQFLVSAMKFVSNVSYLPALVGVFLIIATGLYGIFRSRLTNFVQTVSYMVFAIFYIPFTISYILKLRALDAGVFYIGYVSTITVMTDVGGYFFGKFLGKRSINLPVSPKKTWEGYAGAFGLQLFASFLYCDLGARFFGQPVFSPLEIIAISILIFISSVFGDLFESLIKRNASTKDSGSFLPGHGGLLDRIDSIMFSLPVFYYYLYFFR